MAHRDLTTQLISRRAVLLGSLGLAGSAALGACTSSTTGSGQPSSVGSTAPATASPGQKVVTKTLTAKPVTLDLGGPTVRTWAYANQVPGPVLRATAGDLLRVTLDNQLPADTTIHWHGIRLRNAADGVPGVTQDPVRPGTTFVYEFTAPDPGTYFFHPHVGVQLDRGLYAPMVIDDPREPGQYDAEWILVLDDWVDGTGRTPDEVLQQLVADGGTTGGGMGAMGHGSMGGMSMGPAPWGDAGDVTYPHFLLNGKVPTAPDVLVVRPGRRVRLRIINAASDTIFTVALAGHQMTVTHSDGYAVQPQQVPALYVGMGERYDATVTLTDGVFPFVAVPFGKQGTPARALVRTGAGTPPSPDAVPAELRGDVLTGSRLVPAEVSRLPPKPADVTANVTLQGSMQPYQWGINGASFGKNQPLTVRAGQRSRLNLANMTMMAHPVHLHGHTFALPSGLRKDTVLLAPMQSLPIDLDADNTGDWVIHCHNAYHAEAGMMIALNYRA